ncbi:MAG: helix-turn-helix transcriptional regulator, partial [Chloroflexi bacterium]|nr:helix-turn-helix transcriptional regulator [Chloroflexota bacterium]
MTQEGLAGESGVSLNVICRLEKGSNTTLRSLYRLCEALDVTLAALATLARV